MPGREILIPGGLAVHLAVVVELQSEGAPALGEGAQVGGVAEHVRQGGGSGDEADGSPGHQLFGLTPAAMEVPQHLAGKLLRGDDFQFHDGLQKERLSGLQGLFDRGHGGDAEGHLRGLAFF